MRSLAFSLSAAASLALLTVQTSAAQPSGEPAGASAQPEPGELALENGEGRKVAEALADQLLLSFVIPENARDYAAMLRKNAAAGRYDAGNRAALAKMLTDDLQAVHKDGHLHVEVREAGPAGAATRPGKDFPPLIQAAKTIAPGVGYIRFSAFFGNEEEMAGVRQWLADNVKAETLIFDLRNHHGGGLDEQDAIFSYIYDQPTPLVKMTVSKSILDQGRFPFEASDTIKVETIGDRVIATHGAVPGPATPLRKAKIYLLTSNRTASAAEHFALALKSTGRATLIGEATAGANHFGGGQPLNDHFGVWMPVGRTYDIKTGKDWEGDGIAPDIAVDPRQALVVALTKAGLSQAEAVKLDALEVPAEPVHREKKRAG